jgi:hypothetical protein
MRSNRAKLLAVFGELRRAAGADVPAGTLLRLAAYIVRASNAEPNEIDGFGRPSDSRAFAALPVDEAIRDGGWRILDFETRRDCGLDRLDSEELEHLNSRIAQYLGSEWQHRIRLG